MKRLLSLFISTIIILLNFFNTVNTVNAGDLLNSKANPYCATAGTCGLDEGLKELKNASTGIDGLESTDNAADYLQSVVAYILGFLGLAAVIIIIYAGINLLFALGDEEKAKKSKNIIKYAVFGLIIIFLAYPILQLLIEMFGPQTVTIGSIDTGVGTIDINITK